MTTSLIPKKYDPSFETELYTRWKESGHFLPNQKGKESFVIPLPPPNVTGDLHLGHSVMLAIEDVMTRYARMQGKNTLWIPGTDHAGISTQVVVERNLRRDEKKTRTDLGRTKFLEEIRRRVRKSRSTITSQVASMGASIDRSREQFTLSEQLSRSVRKAFVSLYGQGKIYRDTYMVNRSPGAQTVLSDLEVENRTEQTKLYYIKYFVDGKGESLTVATVRPETMFGDVAIAVHPKDRRYKRRIGKNVLIPIINRSIPIIADESVSMEFGTGILKITPAHAEEDFLIAKKHNLPIDIFALDLQNRYTAHAGPTLEGRDAYEFMGNLTQQIDEIGNLEKIVPYETTIPYCERTGCRVQPMLSRQRFFDVRDAATKVQGAIAAGEVDIHPERFDKQFHNWLDQIKPRCISRQLWWGHRIPVWYDTEEVMHAYDEDSAVIPTKGKKIIMSQIIFNLIADSRLPNPFTIEACIDALLQPSLTPQHGLLYQVYANIYRTKYVKDKKLIAEIEEIVKLFDAVHGESTSLVSGGDTLIELFETSVQIQVAGDGYEFVFPHGSAGVLRQDEDVLDTWFSSGLRPFSILGRPEQTTDLAQYYPATVLETGYDIIFFRVIRMMLMGVSLTDQMPFRHIYLHGLVRAEDGQKMSKSKGNGIDPLQMIEKYGADALRGSLILGNTPGNDQKFTEKKIEYVWRFINKLWNATRFVQGMLGDLDTTSKSYLAIETALEDDKKLLQEYDLWIMNKLHDTVISATKYHDKFMLGDALQEVIDFIRHDFCDRYVEIVKGNQSAITPAVLLYILGTCFKLLHPSLPFVSEKLWQLLGFDEPLIIAHWPTPLVLGTKNYKFNLLMDMITQWRALRQGITQKPHEEVQLLVQANNDIHTMVTEHSELTKKLLHATQIHILAEKDPIPAGFETGLLMDIKLGVQGIVLKDRKTQLAELEKSALEEEQFLQRLRIALSSPDFLGKAPPEVIAEKKQKMEEVKANIFALHHEIQRIKMEHK